MATKNKGIDYYMGLPYAAEVKRDEDGWFAKVVELPGCMTWADSFDELGPMIEDAKRGWIEDALEHGDPVPEPKSTEDYSGKVNLRMPKSLHRDLARLAEYEGVSLNQLMVANLARSVSGARSTNPSDKEHRSWEQVAAKALGVSVEELRAVNPERSASQVYRVTEEAEGGTTDDVATQEPGTADQQTRGQG